LPAGFGERCVTPGSPTFPLRVSTVVVVHVVTAAVGFHQAHRVVAVIVAPVYGVPVRPVAVPRLARHAFLRVAQLAVVISAVFRLAFDAFCCGRNERIG
jgi:hypothetical protein